MKHHVAIFGTAVLFLFGATHAVAQSQQTAPQQQPPSQAQKAQQPQQQQKEGQGQPSANQQQQQPQELMGQTVSTPSGEKLGTVENVRKDESGKPSYVILSRGQGGGQDQMTIPYAKIRQQGAQQGLVADVDFSELQQLMPQGRNQGKPADALDSIMGQEVRGSGGETLGTINNIIIGSDAGTFVVVQGENQENFPIPLAAFEQQSGQEGLRIDQDKKNFETAPSYSQNLPDLNEWGNVIHGYYGVETEGKPQAKKEDADITVRQPSPQVQIEQPQPEVQVKQAQPEVSVQQKQAQVDVRQQKPKVQVTQPAPQVEVQVKQPEPRVQVQQPQPQVQVDQPKPEVQVDQPQPQVAVNQPEPDVKFERSQPQVEVKKSEPDVQVRQQDPKVNVQGQERAQVTIEQQKEADVDIRRQGEPQVNVAQTPGQGQQDQQGVSADQADADQARKFIDKTVVDRNGQELGKVSDLTASSDGRIMYLLVKAEDDTVHPVPADMVELNAQGDKLQARFDQETFRQSPGFGEGEQQVNQGEWEQDVRGYYEKSQQ